MSFPIPKYRCTGCDWIGYGGGGVGRRRYRLPSGGYLNMDRKTVWCPTCGALRTAESIPSVQEAEAEITQKQTLLDDKLADAKARPWRWIGSEFRRAVRNARDDLDAAICWREFFAHRSSAPRCLACGGMDFQDLPSHQFRGRQDLVQLDFQHPGCIGGGHIVGHWGNLTGGRTGTPLHAYEYSVDGELVAKVIDQLPAPQRWR
jgi:hypothetical protein